MWTVPHRQVNRSGVARVGMRQSATSANGYFMPATNWKGQRYMQAFSHIPLLSAALAGPTSGTYDLVTLEPPPIGHAGVASLYSRSAVTTCPK